MKRAATNIVTVRGEQFCWRVLREPHWCTASGWKGVAVLVEPVARDSQRELILEFPFKVEARRSTPHRQRPKLPSARIAECINAALESGWEPQSRGKPFVFAVPKNA